MYLLRYISLKKIINILKVYLGYFASIVFKKVILLGSPFSLTTEPTNNCNLHCIECPTGNNTSKREKGNVDFELYQKIIDELKDYILFQMIYFQGEPFQHPDIFKIINYADQNKIYTSTSTNGHFLSQENCHKIVQSGLKNILVSVDGTAQETYEKYRVGGTLQKILKGIETLVKTKQNLKSKFPTIHLQYLVFKYNQHQMSEIRKISKLLGVNKLDFKSAQIENEENYSLIPDIKRYSRYKYENGEYTIKNKMQNRCFRIWSTLVISWDGNIVPCCFDKDLDFIMGNVKQTPILKVWKSENFIRFRKSTLLNRKKTSICRNCTEGLRIKS
jgi:radical SAM protein with 4Fe4S-binding SPASM domain